VIFFTIFRIFNSKTRYCVINLVTLIMQRKFILCSEVKLEVVLVKLISQPRSLLLSSINLVCTNLQRLKSVHFVHSSQE